MASQSEVASALSILCIWYQHNKRNKREKPAMKIVRTISCLFLAKIAQADVVQSMIDWVNSNGGSLNEKIEIRRLDPSDSSSPMGVFAKERLEQEEIIMYIPTSLYLNVWDEATNMDELEGVEAFEANNSNLCKLTHKLAKEMKLGEKSQFAPYIAYLKTQREGQLPALWAEEARTLLRSISQPKSQIVDWIEDNFQKKGCISEDPFEVHMLALVLQRSFDAAMIPLWDMVNHDNGRINTKNTSIYSKKGIEVMASRVIDEGEEIFASYDLCLDCFDVEDYWGTQEVLKDFGFVEPYPHRWIEYNNGKTIWYLIMEVDGELKVAFDTVDEDGFGVPDKEDVEILKKELKRLESMESELQRKRNSSIPDYQWDTIVKFFHAKKMGLSMAIEAASGNAAYVDF
ncbi:hypothetical protein CTEN210_00160 [Chaetoceros tenuissimus]|uniref:SET domain-containing protein n=1 Tax=Chaetoceros tenuissimus TaxID=426638 RepID=A0AAD3CCR2_9STRA|nr:hypothetical protein CTEN210_00160 [Chaetoceros tenuissimus]